MRETLFGSFSNKHPTHRMHPNSRESYPLFDCSTREQQVIGVLIKCGPMTDRQICERLGSADMNHARPSITALHDRGILIEISKVKCETTGRSVRLSKYP